MCALGRALPRAWIEFLASLLFRTSARATHEQTERHAELAYLLSLLLAQTELSGMRLLALCAQLLIHRHNAMHRQACHPPSHADHGFSCACSAARRSQPPKRASEALKKHRRCCAQLLSEPTPTNNYVIDDAGTINKTTKKTVNDRLKRLEIETGYRLEAVTVRRLEVEADAFAFVDRLLDNWCALPLCLRALCGLCWLRVRCWAQCRVRAGAVSTGSPWSLCALAACAVRGPTAGARWRWRRLVFRAAAGRPLPAYHLMTCAWCGPARLSPQMCLLRGIVPSCILSASRAVAPPTRPSRASAPRHIFLQTPARSRLLAARCHIERRGGAVYNAASARGAPQALPTHTPQTATPQSNVSDFPPRRYPNKADAENKGVLLIVTAGKDGALSGGSRFVAAVGDEFIDSVIAENIPVFTQARPPPLRADLCRTL